MNTGRTHFKKGYTPHNKGKKTRTEEEDRACRMKYRNAHKKEAKEYAKNYYPKNKDKWKISKEKYILNYSKNRDKILSRSRDYWKKRRKEILNFLGESKCKVCGFIDERALQIDHVNSDGYKERKESSTMTVLYRKIKENPQNYQILCANCNWIKKVEKNEFSRIRKYI